MGKLTNDQINVDLFDEVQWQLKENARLRKALGEMTTIAMWSARRLHPVFQSKAYVAIEKALGKEVERV